MRVCCDSRITKLNSSSTDNSTVGSGSILEALDFDSALIAVPNPTLMDNHQSEIAEEMDSQGHLIQGKIGYVYFSSIFFLLT